MKLLVLKPKSIFTLPDNYIIRGISIEYPTVVNLANWDDLKKVIQDDQTRFKLVYNYREEIMFNLPMAIFHRNFVLPTFQEAMVFKYVRPFLLRKGSSLYFSYEMRNFGLLGYPPQPFFLILYGNVISDDEVERYLKEKKLDTINITLLKSISIPMDTQTGFFHFERPSRVISIGFCIPQKVEEAAQVFYRFPILFEPIYGGQEPIRRPIMEDDINIRILLSGQKYDFWDSFYRPIKLLIGDLQEGKRLILKGITIGDKKKKTPETDFIQFSLEKDINSINFIRLEQDKLLFYGPLNVLIEYVYL